MRLRALRNGSLGVFPDYYERIALWTSDLSEAAEEDRALCRDARVPCEPSRI